MSNLMKNINKYIVSKLIDLAEVIGFIALMFYGVYLFGYNSLYAFGSVIVSIVIYWLVDKLIKMKLDRWTVPELDIAEKKKLNIADTFYSVIFAAVILVFFYRYIKFNYWFISIFAVLIIVKEIIKWRKFMKEVKTEINNVSKEVEPENIPEGDVKK